MFYSGGNSMAGTRMQWEEEQSLQKMQDLKIAISVIPSIDASISSPRSQCVILVASDRNAYYQPAHSPHSFPPPFSSLIQPFHRRNRTWASLKRPSLATFLTSHLPPHRSPWLSSASTRNSLISAGKIFALIVDHGPWTDGLTLPQGSPVLLLRRPRWR